MTVPAAACGPYLAQRDGGSSAPSRAAAIGATRVARSAGRTAAIIVITIPTSSEITIVRVLNTVDACGKLIPNDTSSELSALASSRPRNSPTIDASVPIANASTSTERRTWRRDAPSVRSVASSRVRWAIVIDSVFAITKLPTNSAIPPNASRKSWKMLRKPLVSFVACCACACPVLTWALGPSSGLIWFTTCCGV